MFAHLIVLLAVLLVVARAYTPAETTILDYVEEYKKHSATAATLCKTNKCCTISESESCAITGFTKDESTLVLPGGETRCIFSTSTPFAFQVRISSKFFLSIVGKKYSYLLMLPQKI